VGGRSSCIPKKYGNLETVQNQEGGRARKLPEARAQAEYSPGESWEGRGIHISITIYP
jgi:hypothetical protein